MKLFAGLCGLVPSWRSIQLTTSIFIFLMSSSGLSAQGPERIISYDSRIELLEDGSMAVTEQIQVVSTGDLIKRGIYRDFPTRYKSRGGKWIVVRFDVIQVLRDGQTEDYHMENHSNGKRVYIGNKDVFLDPGVYTYTIAYRTDRQLGFFRYHDELYWNVTGNGWEFDIERASATLILPKSIRGQIMEYDGYTGSQGARGKNFHAGFDDRSNLYFETSYPLLPRQGLTIVLTWPKGLIPEPTSIQKARYFYQDNLALLVGIAGCLILLAYYLIDWFRVGRDPAKGTPFPLFNPPGNLSPAAMRYIRRKGYDPKAFTAALINMAVKGCMRIDESDDVFSVHQNTSDVSELSKEEAGIHKELFAQGKQLSFLNANHTIIGKAITSLKTALGRLYQKTYFRTNRTYFVLGAILSVVILTVNLFVFPDKSVFGIVLWLTLWSAGVSILIYRVYLAWKTAIMSRTSRNKALGIALFLSFFTMPFIAGEFMGLFGLWQYTSPLWILIVVAIIIINVVFYKLLEAFTPAGRKLMDEIDGFRMFLSVSEKDKIHQLNPHARTLETFEKYLPYAIALDVEEAWSDQFTEVLMSAQQGQRPYQTRWYTSSSSTPMNFNSFMSSIGSSFSAAISSSSSAPGSSSGSGGGGSSGGGGGGGGGGGW